MHSLRSFKCNLGFLVTSKVSKGADCLVEPITPSSSWRRDFPSDDFCLSSREAIPNSQ